jgi:hypothetical protein
MRVNDNSQNKTADQTAQPQAAQQTHQPQPQQGYSNNTRYNEYDGTDPFDGLGVTTLSGGMDTEGFAAFSEEMKRLAGLPEISNMLKLEVVSVSSQQLYLPVLALCAVSSATKQVVVYNLLIEGMMSSKLEPIVETIRDYSGQKDIITDRPTTRCFDSKLREVVSTFVASQYKVNPADVVHIGHCVVPKAADLSSAEVTRVYFDSAHLAIIDAAGGQGVGRVTAKHLRNPQVAVRQRTTITPGECRLNRIGQPIAADFNTSIKLTRVNQKQGDMYQVHTGTQEHNLAEVSGYIDFNIITQQQSSPYAQLQQPQVPKPGYMPVVILTEVAGLANSGRSIEDLRTQLMGLVATLAMTANHGWVRVFETYPGQKTQKQSIGLLGLEYDPYGRGPEALGKVPVESVSLNKVPEEGKETPFSMANKWCTQNVAVALDVEQGGRLEWVQSVFIAAAQNPRSGANDDIIAECDALTGGAFSQVWAQANSGNAKAAVMHHDTVTVHLGTYTDKDGRARDLRTIDYLTMLAASPKDLQFVAQATAAMTPGIANNINLSDRRRCLMSVAGDCNINGMATRVYFSPNFIPCLVQALINNDVRIISDDMVAYDQGMQRQGIDPNFGGTYNAAGFYQSPYGQTGPMGEQMRGSYINPVFNKPFNR